MVDPAAPRSLVANWGLGADSTAWLLLLIDVLNRRDRIGDAAVQMAIEAL